MQPTRRHTLASLATGLVLLASAAAPAAAATDPMLEQQWALNEPAAIGAPEAWTQTRGDGVIVAVLDSGVQLDHPDLAANLWTNPGEVAGNGVDDDHNGYVDDVHGVNTIDHSGNVGDDGGHGTHVAGIVAARGGNGVGGSGLAPDARIMAIKVLDANTTGNSEFLAEGIRYAVDKGARILNVSLNGDGSSSTLDDAIRYAGQKGATIVASSGNNGRDLDVKPSYPASSSDPAVLTVSASDDEGNLLSFANRGLNSVDLAAPGMTILSTALGSKYEFRAGTSMAAPYVAGALALLSAARPDMSQSDLRGALLASAPRLKGLTGLLGSGELNVASALHAILPGDRWRSAPAVAVAASVPAATLLRLRLRTDGIVRAGGRAALRWSATGTTKVASWQVTLDGRKVASLGSGRARVVRKRVARAGTHRWKVVAYDAAGQRVTSATRSFKVLRAR